MCLEPAVLGFFECKRESIEQLLRAEPDEATAPGRDRRMEDRRESLADPAADAVGADDQVGIGELGVRSEVGLEHETHAQRFAACLQDIEEPLAADSAKAVSTRANGAALEVDVDVVPVIEAADDLVVCGTVGIAEIAERLIREHDAPAKRVVGSVAFDDGDLVRGIRALQQQRKIEARGAAANADDSHGFHRIPTSGAI